MSMPSKNPGPSKTPLFGGGPGIEFTPEGCLHRLSLFGYATRFVYRPSVASYSDDTRLTNPDTSGATATIYLKPKVEKHLKIFGRAIYL